MINQALTLNHKNFSVGSLTLSYSVLRYNSHDKVTLVKYCEKEIPDSWLPQLPTTCSFSDKFKVIYRPRVVVDEVTWKSRALWYYCTCKLSHNGGGGGGKYYPRPVHDSCGKLIIVFVMRAEASFGFLGHQKSDRGWASDICYSNFLLFISYSHLLLWGLWIRHVDFGF